MQSTKLRVSLQDALWLNNNQGRVRTWDLNRASPGFSVSHNCSTEHTQKVGPSMSAARACLHCRAAKVKCDREQPSCARCDRYKLVCTGSSAAHQYIFRDQRETARTNSQRARKEGIFSRAAANSLDPLGSRDGKLLVLQQHYDWLNACTIRSLPEALRRDIDSRAIDRFFVDWIMFPGNDGFSPGHLHTLPQLYHSASEQSLLWHAVRAMAFADMGRSRTGDSRPFAVKARRSYGDALTSMRSSVASEQELVSDRTFAALILIDCFESMYLAQSAPLGVHSMAVRYLMEKRGKDQIYDRSRLDLWRVANCRLQARQLHAGEEPDSSQIEVLSKLNMERPDFHVSADIMQMTSLCATAKRILNCAAPPASEDISQLLTAILETITSIDSWTSRVTGVWQPRVLDSRIALKLEEMRYNEHAGHPLSHYHCETMLTYAGTWFAYIWNFHAASQIILREHLVSLLQRRCKLEQRDLDDDELCQFEEQKGAVNRLATSILQSFPPLIGLTDASGERFDPVGQGKVAGRFLTLFSMDVVRKANFASAQHRLVAGDVIDWIYASHSLV